MKEEILMHRCVYLSIFFLFAISVIIPSRVMASWQPEIMVGIFQNISAVQFTGTGGGLRVYDSSGDKPVLIVSVGKVLDVRILHNQIMLNEAGRSDDRLIIRPENGGYVNINGMPYRGYIAVLKKDGLTVVNHVLIEDYLYGVVPKEMPSGWPVEALRAQSVAARTFALKNRKRYSAEGFDLCNTANCQVYEGMAAETQSASSAVDSTRGEVLFHKGEIIDAFFHTDSGGMTESCENVWGRSVSYLRAVTELQMQTMPWSRTIPMNLFVQKIEAAGKHIGKVREIRLSPLHIGQTSGDRSTSGRVRSVEIVGEKERAVLDGNSLRGMFSLPSTLFNIRYNQDNIRFDGFGAGHGLGMSQRGAKAFADKGKSYKEILQHYYMAVTLEKLY